MTKAMGIMRRLTGVPKSLQATDCTGAGGSDTLTRTNYVTVTSAAVGDLVTITITYAYDPLYRLTSAAYSSGEVYTYTYDEVGNRTAMTKAVESTVAFTHVYEYDDGNRLTKVDDQAYTWDANGNLLSDGARTFTLRYTQDGAYDAANRLAKVVSGTITTTFAYNGDGGRMSKVADGVTTTYVVALLGLSLSSVKGLPQVLMETTE